MEQVPVADPVDPDRVPTPLSGPFEAERERTIETLTRSFEKGVMTVDEYDERVELASTAATGAELEVLLQDLAQPKGTMIPERGSALEKETLTAFFGDQNRQGTWRLARTLRVKSIFGHVRVDMGEATWPGDEADVICSPFFGTIVIRVPPDTIVEVRAGAFLGDVDNRIQETGAPKVRRLIVRGRALFGSLRIETVYPKGIGRK